MCDFRLASDDLNALDYRFQCASKCTNSSLFVYYTEKVHYMMVQEVHTYSFENSDDTILLFKLVWRRGVDIK